MADKEVGGIVGAAIAGGMSPGRIAEMGKGRGTPAKRQLPFARHMGIHIIVGQDPAAGDDSVAAKNDAIASWDLWKKDTTNERLRVLELQFEYITEGKVALYIIYSE